jgi:hypothetical protein
MKAAVILAAVGIAAYWAYRNGWGALVGACPTGFHLAQNVTATCQNDNAGACGGLAPAAPLVNGLYSNDPPNGYEWGCVNGASVYVLSAPKWP